MTEVSNISGWLEENGWNLRGYCGCRENYGLYTNVAYPTVLIKATRGLFMICIYMGDNINNSKTFSQGSSRVFSAAYNLWIVNNKLMLPNH